MNTFKATGIIKSINESSFTNNDGEIINYLTFQIDTGSEYNNIISFNIFGDKAENFKKYNKENDNVDVSFNISCKSYNDKVYTSLIAWRVFKVDSKNEVNNVEETNDLPF